MIRHKILTHDYSIFIDLALYLQCKSINIEQWQRLKTYLSGIWRIREGL
jgi:hypothetical protein